MSSSSAEASANWSSEPASETWNVADSLAVLPSSACASVTACHVLQFDGLNVKAAPPAIAMLSLPDARATVTTLVAPGFLFSRTKKRPSPFSRTFKLVRLSTTAKSGSDTSKVLVTSGAAL